MPSSSQAVVTQCKPLSSVREKYERSPSELLDKTSHLETGKEKKKMGVLTFREGQI